LGAQLEPLDIIEKIDPEKPSFRPSKWPRKLKTAKNSKLPKLPENCFEPVGKGGWPLISTWITKLGIKDFKQHIVMKYRGDLHRYIQNEMDFLNISLLGVAYRYVFKTE
jgi:hypothetical protein